MALHTPFTRSDLDVSLQNCFNRLTLVNKNFSERCTIDINLQFNTDYAVSSLNELAIIEIKRDRNTKLSPIALALRDMRIKSNSFSKYCIGRAYTDFGLKQNRFKEQLRTIEKTICL